MTYEDVETRRDREKKLILRPQVSGKTRSRSSFVTVSAAVTVCREFWWVFLKLAARRIRRTVAVVYSGKAQTRICTL